MNVKDLIEYIEDPEWKECLKDELKKPYIQNLKAKLNGAARLQPHPSNFFRCLNLTPLSKVRVVILGKDPYPTLGDANGLAFGTFKHRNIPPSLNNIFKELKNDLGDDFEIPKTGELEGWAEQDILLLNTVLSIGAIPDRGGSPISHAFFGWQMLTDRILQILIDHSKRNSKPLVFIAWGSDASKKLRMVSLDPSLHLVLKSVHPSPNAQKESEAFFNNHHFSQTNSFLQQNGLQPINWSNTRPSNKRKASEPLPSNENPKTQKIDVQPTSNPFPSVQSQETNVIQDDDDLVELK